MVNYRKIYDATLAISFLAVLIGFIAFTKCSSRDATQSRSEFYRSKIPIVEQYVESKYKSQLSYKLP